MSTTVNFFGNVYVEPGAAAHIINGESVPPQLGSYGNAFLLDSGTGAGYIGGSGINGQLKSGIDAIYSISTPQDLQRFVRGGIFWDAAKYLFSPAPGADGIDTLFMAAAATTTAASVTCNFANSNILLTAVVHSGSAGTGYNVGDIVSVNGGTTLALLTITAVTTGAVTAFTITDPGAGYAINSAVVTTTVTGSGTGFKIDISSTAASGTVGSITFSSNNEGVGGNGATVTTASGQTVVSRGNALTLSSGVINPSAFVLNFYQGQFSGLDAYNNNAPYDCAENQCSNNMICSSPEFTSIKALLNWAANDYQFGLYYTVTASTTSSYSIDISNLSSYISYQLFAGGTETYTSANVDTILSLITDEDNAFFLSDQYGDNALNVVNTKIITHIQRQATVKEKIVFIGGGNDNTRFTQSPYGSIPVAAFYNTPRAVVVHSAVKVPYQTFGGQLQYKFAPTFISAAIAMARFSGVEPQVNGTWKTVGIYGLKHELSQPQRVQALQAGVFHYRKVTGLGYAINEQINTMQQNSNTVATNGDSPQISIERIKMQLNKELIQNAAIRFVGGNLDTASATDVTTFVTGYLQGRTVTPTVDNLIISFAQVKAVFTQDYWQVTYGFVPNGPVNKMFFTGAILDPNFQIPQ